MNKDIIETDWLTLKKESEFVYKVYFKSNQKKLGQTILDVDGYWYFVFENNGGGHWSSFSLKIIADTLEDLNKEYDEHIKNYFKNEKEL